MLFFRAVFTIKTDWGNFASVFDVNQLVSKLRFNHGSFSRYYGDDLLYSTLFQAIVTCFWKFPGSSETGLKSNETTNSAYLSQGHKSSKFVVLMIKKKGFFFFSFLHLDPVVRKIHIAIDSHERMCQIFSI